MDSRQFTLFLSHRWARLAFMQMSIIVIAATNACKPAKPPPKSSTLKEIEFTGGIQHCQDCSVECMQRASGQATDAQVQCLRSIVDAIGPGWMQAIASATDIVAAINAASSEQIQLVEAAEDLQTNSQLPQSDVDATTNVATNGTSSDAQDPGAQTGVDTGEDWQTDSNLPTLPAGQTEEGLSLAEDGSGVVGAITMSTWNILNIIISQSAEQYGLIKPRWLQRCTQNAASFSGSIATVISGATSLASSQTLSASEMINLATAVGTSVQAVLELGRILNTCTPVNNARAAVAFNRFVERFRANLGKMSLALGAITAVGRCGINIANGAIVLASNSACMIGDLNKLMDSYASLESARERILPIDGQAVAPQSGVGTYNDGRPIPNTAAVQQARCNNEPLNCAGWGMGVWGEELRRHSISIFTWRSSYCAQMCSNRRSDVAVCSAAAQRIFSNTDRACDNICKISQCRQAVERCVSYCCSQEIDCIRAAHSTMTTNGWD